MNRFEWIVLQVSGFPFMFFHMNGQKTNIGYNVETIDDANFNSMMATKAGLPAENVDAELRRVLTLELQKLRLTPLEVKDALAALPPV